MSVLQIGSQRPTLLHEPFAEADLDWTLSDIAVDFADAFGYVLDEWQRWLVRWTFARLPGGGPIHLWAARDVGAEVTRQSGKNIWLEVVELAGATQFGDKLQVHSAHRADTSHEHFVSLRGRIESNDELMEMMPPKLNRGFITTNGNESIEFANGHRILFKSRTNASGRGPRPQRIVFDEALVLKHEQVGSMAPGISAQPNPQIIFASSAPKSDSEVLHGLRARALSPEKGDRFFYAAWNNEADIDDSDPASWYRVNPSLGYGRMTEDSLNANRRLMSHDEFRREHLGIPEDPTGSGNVAIPGDLWESLVDENSSIDSHFAIALDVSLDRKWASFAVAGRRDDGLFHIDIADRRGGTGWVVARALELSTKWNVPIRVDKSSPAGGLLSLLHEAGVDVVELTVSDHVKATGQFIDACHSSTLRHLGGTYLRSAVAGAVLRASGDAEMWARRSSKVDITPLVAATIALAGVPDVAPYTEPNFYSLDDFLDDD